MTTEFKTKLDIFTGTTILFSFIAFIGYIFAFAKSEGTIGNCFISNFVADYTLYLFPAIFLADKFNLFSPILLLALFGLNIMFYSLIIVRVSRNFLKSIKRYKPFLATYYLTISILLTILTHIVFLILTSK